MSTGSTLKKFNPLDMSKEDVIALATGREKLLGKMLEEMEACIESQISQHYVLFGPRGIGKSFFIRLLNIHHDKSKKFAKSIFIQLPEETDNIRYVADLMDIISNKLEGGHYVDTRPKWEMTEYMWSESKKRLNVALSKINKEGKQHVFVGIENLQDFIPKLEDVENGRMREFLSDFYQITLIGSSLRPDLDSDYNKKLFQVFKKIDIEPWKADDYIEFYQKKASISTNQKEQENQLDISENKIKAIAAFTGGSPRLAVILSSLVLDKKIIETAVLLDNIIDDLTAYYQDLIKDIPLKSKVLFDMLIRIGENVTQSELAKAFDPPLEQRTIARSFTWLLDNYYVVYKKQAKGNTKNYFVRDRLFVLYYQKRQVFADQLTSFVGVFVDFLTEYFSQKEWKEQIMNLDLTHPYSTPIMLHYSESRGLKMDEYSESEHIQISIVSDIENVYTNNKTLINEENIKKQALIDRLMKKAEQYYDRKNYNKSFEIFLEILEIKPEDAKINYNLGVLSQRLGDETEALAYYKTATKLNSEIVDAYNNIGIILKTKGDLDNAIKNYEIAIRLNPKDHKAYINLGVAMKAKGEISKAIDHYKMSIQLKSNYRIAYINMAALYYEQGDWKNAEYWILKGLDEIPNEKSLIKGLFELYIIQSKWKEISHFDKELPKDVSKDKLIGRALVEAMNHKIVESFLLFKDTLNFIQTSHPEWLIGFVISLTMHLFATGNKEILATLVDELKQDVNNNQFLAIILECWGYLQDPENQDIAKLHPDARIVASKIMELENIK